MWLSLQPGEKCGPSRGWQGDARSTCRPDDHSWRTDEERSSNRTGLRTRFVLQYLVEVLVVQKSRYWYFNKFLLFSCSNPSLKLNGDQMGNYHTHFAQEWGLSCGTLIGQPCPPPRANLHPNSLYDQTYRNNVTDYKQKTHQRTECFGRNIYWYSYMIHGHMW